MQSRGRLKPTPSGRRTGPRPEITCRVRGPAGASERPQRRGPGLGGTGAGGQPAAGGHAAQPAETEGPREGEERSNFSDLMQEGEEEEERQLAGNKDRAPRLVGFDSALPIPQTPAPVSPLAL